MIYLTIISIILLGLCIFFVFRYNKVKNAINQAIMLFKEDDYSFLICKTGVRSTDNIIEGLNLMLSKIKSIRVSKEEQSGFINKIIEASPVGVILFDFDMKISSMNSLAKKFEDFFISPEFEEIKKLKQEESLKITIDNEILKFSMHHFVDRGFNRNFILIESLTEEVFFAQKKSYEKLIRMIAHEVNNSSACISSSMDTIKECLSDEDQDLKQLASACSERTHQMSQFITRFAEVVKIPEANFSKVDINKLILNCKTVFESFCSEKNIKLTLSLNQEEIIVDSDAVLLSQAIVNIVKNASEACQNNGTINITTSNNPLEINIIDNGMGISKENEQKIFNPFFTTKPSGQGIGLMFVRDIANKLNLKFSLKTIKEGQTIAKLYK